MAGVSLTAYLKIFLLCFVASLLVYLVLNSPSLIRSLLPSAGNPPLTLLRAVPPYFNIYVLWALVPACCGAMSAYTIDRPADTLAQRAISGLLLGTTMGVVAIIVAKMLPDLPPDATSRAANINFWFDAYNLVVYGGLGGIIGFMLPAALRRYWQSIEQRWRDRPLYGFFPTWTKTALLSMLLGIGPIWESAARTFAPRSSIYMARPKSARSPSPPVIGSPELKAPPALSRPGRRWKRSTKMTIA